MGALNSLLRASFILVALLLSGLPHARATSAASVPATMVKIANHEFVRVGACAEATASNLDGIANIGFIIGQKLIAVIDPGGSLADGQRLRAAILAESKLPIGYVIFTHSHPDHVFGAAAFLPDHPVFVGHWRLPAALAQRGAYDRKRLETVLGNDATGSVIAPTLLVHGTTKIDLGERVIDLQAQEAAHTDTDLTVFDESTRTLWAGDLLFVGRIPALDGNLAGWLRTLHTLSTLPASRAVPGHGPASVPWPQGATGDVRYLTTLQHDVRAGLAEGDDVDKVAATAGLSERQKWALFDDYNGRNAIEAFKELQWE